MDRVLVLSEVRVLALRHDNEAVRGGDVRVRYYLRITGYSWQEVTRTEYLIAEDDAYALESFSRAPSAGLPDEFGFTNGMIQGRASAPSAGHAQCACAGRKG